MQTPSPQNPPPWTFGSTLYPRTAVEDSKTRFPKSTHPDRPFEETILRAGDPVLDNDVLASYENNDDPDKEELCDTHLKFVADESFRVWVSTRGLGEDPGTPFTMWMVDVNDSFRPDASIVGRGIIAGITPKYTRDKRWRNNRWILYTLLCMWEQLGIVQITPVFHDELEQVKATADGFDEELQVDNTFKRIYNAVIEYYQRNRSDARFTAEFRTKFDCPMVFPNREAGRIEKYAVREVDTEPWLDRSNKYTISE